MARPSVPDPADRQVRFQARLLDAVEQAVIAMDVAGRVLYWNSFAERLYGWSRAEALGRQLGELLVPEGMQALGADIIAQVCSGSSWSGEFTVRRRDGTRFPVHVTDSPIYDDDGTLIGIIGISFDVTERRRADEVRQRLAAIVTSSDEAIAAWAPDGTVMSWNPGAERIYGYTADEIVGRSITAMVPSDRVSELDSTIERLRRGDRVERYTTQRIHKDGRHIDVSISASPLLDAAGELIAVAGIARDVTAQEVAQRQLCESEQRFRSLFAHHPDAVYALDVEGRYRAANPACEPLSGFTPDEILGRVSGERASSPDAHKQALEVAMSGVPVTFESAVRHRDGHAVPVQITLVPTVVDGAIVGVYGIAKDITEMKRAQEALGRHAREHASVADLGLLALTEMPLEDLFTATVTIIASILNVELASMFEVLHDGGGLLLSAGLGWPDDQIGKRTFAEDPGLLLGFTLARGEAVTIENVRAERRFGVRPVVPEEAASGLAVIVPGRVRHRGVLVAFSKQCRAFSDEDVSFVQATANVLGAAIDRKQSEDELHRREHEFKVLVEHAADNIVRLDHDLRFMYVNPAAESLMGIPASQLVGQTNRDLALRLDLPQSLLLTWDRALRRVLRTGEEEVLELAYPVNNGERYFAVKLSPEFGADGAVNSVLGVGRDITGDKQRDADRAELYGELLARDVRLHELVERVLLSQRESNRRRVLRVPVTEQFSKRDREILRLLARGLTNRQIGQQLNLSAGTIKNHVASLLPRLNAVDRTQAAVRATELGLLGAESKPES